MPNSNRLYEIQERLFGNLEVNIIRNPKKPEEVTFERIMKKFERNNIYIEYNLEKNTLGQIFQYNHKRGEKKILRNGEPNISDSHELNKYALKK